MPVLLKKVNPAYFLILFISFFNKLAASPVDTNSARAVALSFYSRNCNIKVSAFQLAYTEKSEDGLAQYYIYNANSNDGFVIISADDAAYPIIGYVATGHYDPAIQPPEFAYWMTHYKRQLAYIQSHNLKATANIQDEWTAYKNNLPLHKTDKITGSVSPLVKTIWMQSPYFNALCPGGCVAGCIATAMGQIMKYWSYPPHGIDTNGYKDSTYGFLRADFDSTHYNWSAMPINVSSSNFPVAVLSYDCGIAVNMAYTTNSSSATMITADYKFSSQAAYITNFGYDESTIQGLYRYNYSDANWTSMLENELNNGRPIQYAGQGNQGGHSWVCDGYTTTGLFHMNWGWQGMYDGTYNLNTLSPDGIPLDSNEEALIGIQPAPAVADFNANPAIVRAGDTVYFTDNSMSTGTITNWNWTFIGATVGNSSAQNPSVVYSNPGTYTVSETITSTKGNNTLTKTDYVTVLVNNTVNVYPTLNDGNFTVQLHDPGLATSNIQFALYDMLGRKVYSTILTNYITQLWVPLPHGMYFFRAFDSSNKPVSTGKLVMK